MGHAYRGQRSTAHTVHDLLGAMLAASASPSPLVVCNPVNQYEILSEQWTSKPATFGEFRRWLNWFAAGWKRVLDARTVPETQRELTSLFGDELVKKAFVKQAQRLDELRKSGGLGVNRSGALIAGGGFAVRPNTFFGADDE